MRPCHSANELHRVVIVEVDADGVSRVEPAREGIVRGGREAEVQDPLVLRGVGVALLDDVVAPGEVAVELAARARGAGHHEPPVPVVREPQQEPRLAAGSSATRASSWRPGTACVIGVRSAALGRDDAAVGQRGEGERPAGRARELFGGVVLGLAVVRFVALEALDVGEDAREARFELSAAAALPCGGECGDRGNGEQGWKPSAHRTSPVGGRRRPRRPCGAFVAL